VDPVPSNPGLREPLLTFFAATLLAAGLALAGRFVPFLSRHLTLLIAAIFLYAPALAGRWSGRGFDYREAGLRLDPLGLNLRVLAAALAVTFPLFAGAFFIFYGAVCGSHAGFIQPIFATISATLCPHWRGLAHGGLRLPPEFLTSALNQLIVVAIPEELFFRGYLLQRLDERWPPARRLLGAVVGPGLWLSSLLFAVGHLLVIPNPQRLAVIFPALVFGWMRARTGSIVPGAVFHALCNLFADVLHTSYF
jgi:membrane protease YdiL (CAAX protease family)